MRPIDADALMEQVCLEGDCTQCKTGVNEKVCKWNMFQLKDVIDCLEHAPTIDAAPHWIPCEERLPNEDEIIYNGVGIDGERKLSDRVLAIDPNGFIRAGYFIKSCKPHKYKGKGAKNKYSKPLVACWEFGEHYMSDPSNWVCGCGFDAVAWMPLPEPYRG